MKIYLKLSLIILTFLAGIQLRAQMPPYVTVDVTVISETGIPIEGVDVIGRFPIRSDLNIPAPRGTTDSEGQVSLRERAVSTIRIEANKTGFYPSSVDAPHHYKWNSETQENEFFDVKTIVTLREIRNPVPMIYNRRRLLEVPEFNRAFGFDFEKADWVEPHGSGENADALITVSGFYNDRDDRKSTLTIRFLNEHDGITVSEWFPESRLRSPHEAPISGYQQEFTLTFGRAKDGRRFENFGSRVSDPLLVFRVRTELDEDENIIRANYGKIEEGISFDGVWDQRSAINFRNLFFNPDPNSKSLEYEGFVPRE